jgi:hypothetical protein
VLENVTLEGITVRVSTLAPTARQRQEVEGQ